MTTRGAYRLRHLPYLAVLLCTILILAAAGASAASPPGSAGPAPTSQAGPGSPDSVESPSATGLLLLSYQGRLADPAGNPQNSPITMTFTLYDAATGGNVLWTETKSVDVTNGLFSTLLGNTFTAAHLAYFDGRDLWLGVQVSGDPNGELQPRIRVAYAPYAIYSSNAAKLGGQLPSAYAGATHQHGAGDITSGALNNAWFSAYGDLQSEGKIGTAGTQVAQGDHQHDGRYFTQSDSNSVFVNDNAWEVDNQDVLNGALAPEKIAGTAALVGHAHDAGAITTGILSTDRYAAIDDLNAGGNVGMGYGQVAPGPHVHYGVAWTGNLPDGFGLAVENQGTGDGIRAFSNDTRSNWAAVYATNGSSGTGVFGASNTGYGVWGSSNPGSGVYGSSSLGSGVYGTSTTGRGVYGISNWAGVYGQSDVEGGIGVWGYSSASSGTGTGVGGGTNSPNGLAGQFLGNVSISGILYKGGGGFKIDHPLNPENKYLNHSFVESPDMKNLYDGVATLDENGEAWVELPTWFGALNRDFRYQLTPIGAPGPNLYIAAEIRDNRFQIAGGVAGMRVSWQVTGIRQDAWANANRIQVEQDKTADQQGKYLHPSAFGQPAEAGQDYERMHPEGAQATIAPPDAGAKK
jgi:hypothetical protein